MGKRKMESKLIQSFFFFEFFKNVSFEQNQTNEQTSQVFDDAQNDTN